MSYKVRNVNGEFWNKQEDGLPAVDDVFPKISDAAKAGLEFLVEAKNDELNYTEGDIEIVEFSGEDIVMISTLSEALGEMDRYPFIDRDIADLRAQLIDITVEDLKAEWKHFVSEHNETHGFIDWLAYYHPESAKAGILSNAADIMGEHLEDRSVTPNVFESLIFQCRAAANNLPDNDVRTSFGLGKVLVGLPADEAKDAVLNDVADVVEAYTIHQDVSEEAFKDLAAECQQAAGITASIDADDDDDEPTSSPQ